MKKFLLCLALAACAPQAPPVVAPVTVDIPPLPKQPPKEEVRYVPQWTIRLVQPWDVKVEVTDPTEIHYKSSQELVNAVSRNGKLLLTCGNKQGSINLCLEESGSIEYACNNILLVVRCKYIKFDIGNPHEEIIQENNEDKEQNNGIGN